MSNAMIAEAEAIMRLNDRGDYTVPTKGLYPFQWNWDSALSALGFAHFDAPRAWLEIETLFDHQWEGGMVPHIIFHEQDDGYFPGPDVWQTGREVPTTGITQPPVAGYAVKRLVDMAADSAFAEARARVLLPKLHAWHAWFYRARDPQGTGLVAIIHPWESGRDNSVDWDTPFEAVPTEGIGIYQRRDLDHADAAHRPTKAQYDRYLWLVHHFRGLGWETEELHDASPFRVVDPGFNGILIRACHDVAELADRFGMAEIAAESRAFAERGLSAMESLWSRALGQYICYDRAAGVPIESPSIGGLLAAFAPIPQVRASAIARRIVELSEAARFMIPSHDPATPEYDGERYWRGPAWLIVNTMVADGLARAGETEVAARIQADSLRLIRESGFSEYYDPITGAPCGGGQFTWTAAMVLDILHADAKADAP